MSDLIEELELVESELKTLRHRLSELGQRRVQLVLEGCARVAKLQIGQEVDVRYGYKHATRRYRITKIGGNNSRSHTDGTHLFFPTYIGRLIKKDGSLGTDEKSLYGIVAAYPLNGEGQPIRGQDLQALLEYTAGAFQL